MRLWLQTTIISLLYDCKVRWMKEKSVVVCDNTELLSSSFRSVGPYSSSWVSSYEKLRVLFGSNPARLKSRVKMMPGVKWTLHWVLIQFGYICSKDRRSEQTHKTAGRGRWHMEEGHDEAKESLVAGDQSIIAPVGLYWLCSPTGLPRSMCFQAFCVGRWGSVPDLPLTFYSDMCAFVWVVY